MIYGEDPLRRRPRKGFVRANRWRQMGPTRRVFGMHNPFRYLNSFPEVIRLAAMMCIHYHR